MTTTTHTTYYPKIKGSDGWFSRDGFSKGGSENYNILDHIHELRNKTYEGKQPYKDAVFQIVSVTTIETTADI